MYRDKVTGKVVSKEEFAASRAAAGKGAKKVRAGEMHSSA